MQNISLLVNDIKAKLNIEGGVFVMAELESYVRIIDPSKYLEFFKALSGDEFAHKNKLDRVAIVAERYRKADENALFGSVEQQAKQLYDKFTAVRIALEKFSSNNRDRFPNDEQFFASVVYENLVDAKQVKTFSSEEVSLLHELGGGEFLLKMPRMANAKTATDKIEAVLKHHIRMGGLDSTQMINSRVTKMLTKVS